MMAARPLTPSRPRAWRRRQRQDGVVVDGLDQARAEDRNRHPADDDVGLGRNRRLAGVAGHREQVEQRLAVGPSASNAPSGRRGGPRALRHRADAAHRRHVVAGGATGAVERRARAPPRRSPPRGSRRGRGGTPRTRPASCPGSGSPGWRCAPGRRRPAPRPRSAPPASDSWRSRRHGCVAARSSAALAGSVATITPRMKSWPAPHRCEHSKV